VIETRPTPPEPGRDAAEAFVATHLADVVDGPIVGSGRFRGGQAAADAALAAFDVTRYASRRNEVLPVGRRGASALSPYVRHGLLGLRTVWDRVAGGPARDVGTFRDELLWQEYARHWYARLGARTDTGVRRELAGGTDGWAWDRTMACVDETLSELERDGWLVNQTRMWLASEWSVRRGARWQDGEDEFFRHLLDGSRAANRLGWQWTTGTGSSKHYGFSRWQVRKRAPELCGRCERQDACPIEHWPAEPAWVPVRTPSAVGRDPDSASTAGPSDVERHGAPDVVWLTAESLGTDDPALSSHTELPVVFVFDRPLLARLRLSAKRLVFLVETLAELAVERELTVVVGEPAEVIARHRPAVTFAPVPGFRRLARGLDLAEVHPARWLARPTTGSVSSFTAWRRSIRVSR
jgi:deoxyribodipyrimidine photo-lyase